MRTISLKRKRGSKCRSLFWTAGFLIVVLVYSGSEFIAFCYNEPWFCLVYCMMVTKGVLQNFLDFITYCFVLFENRLVAEENFDALYTQRAALFKEYSQNYDCRIFIKQPEQQWYTVYWKCLDTFTEQERNAIGAIVFGWTYGTDPHVFDENEISFLEYFIKVLGLNKMSKAAVIDLVSKIEAEANLTATVRRWPGGAICLKEDGTPELIVPELQLFRRIRELYEHELNVTHYDRYYKLTLLEFYHYTKIWLFSESSELGKVLARFSTKRYGANYPLFPLNYYQSAAAAGTTRTTFTTFGPSDVSWGVEKNLQMLRFCTSQLADKAKFNVVLAETATCEQLELQRFLVGYIVNAEREALENGTYKQFFEKHKFIIQGLNRQQTFQGEKQVYELLANSLEAYLQAELEKIFKAQMDEALVGMNTFRRIDFTKRFAVDKFICLCLLYEAGYFASDSQMRHALDLIIKYEWPVYLKTGQFRPFVKIYLNFLHLREGFFDDLQKHRGWSQEEKTLFRGNVFALKHHLIEDRNAKMGQVKAEQLTEREAQAAAEAQAQAEREAREGAILAGIHLQPPTTRRKPNEPFVPPFDYPGGF